VTISIVIPARNEALQIRENVLRLIRDAEQVFSAHDWRIVIAENGSSDETAVIAETLAAGLPNVSARHCMRPGKGGAIREAWDASRADVLAFLDADLAADAQQLNHVIAGLADADLAIGSRRLSQSRPTRSPIRRVVSAVFHAIARQLVDIPVADAQCGCKAMRAQAWQQLSAHISHDGFLFDTELIARAHRANMRIAEIPIVWNDATRSGRGSVRLWRDSWKMFIGLLGLRRALR